MESLTRQPLRILTGLLVAATYVVGQGYTISARPGAINYIEGTAYLNGDPVSDKNLKATFLNANDSFSTGKGRAEVLLTPGVFLRVGEDTQIRMISPSLTDTKVEVISGEIMVEASGLVKDNNLQIVDHGAFITIVKNGLYKFTANNPPTAAVLDGRANVAYDDRKVDLKKGREAILASNLGTQKFDTKQEDDLYAWSNVRSEYEAAASYRVSRDASLSSLNGSYGYGGNYGGNYNGNYGGYNGFGSSGFGPGWMWDSGFNSYAWLPGNGIFYSPFGYGFYSPGYVGYAPVITTSVYRGGLPWRGRNGNTGVTAAVPVSTKNPPAIGSVATSPFSNQQARVQTARSFAAANGGSGVGNVSPGYAGARTSGSGGVVAHASAGSFNGGGGHASAGGFSGGGGHAGGGGRSK